MTLCWKPTSMALPPRAGLWVALAGLTVLAACAPAGTDDVASAEAAPGLLDWSEQIEVREAWLTKRHDMLLPMMRSHGVDMWIVHQRRVPR